MLTRELGVLEYAQELFARRFEELQRADHSIGEAAVLPATPSLATFGGRP
jgi:hypothetical protein